MSQFLSTIGASKSQNHEPKSKSNAAAAEHCDSSGNIKVLELPPKAPPAPEAFEECTNKSAIQQPPQRVSGLSTPELGKDERAELEAAITDSVPSCYQELIAQDPSLFLPETANAETQSAAEPSKQAHYLSSHLTPEQDLSHADSVEPELHTHSTQDAPPMNASFSAPPTPVASLTPSASPAPSIESTSSAPPTRSTAPSPTPVIEHSTTPGSSKRPLESGNDPEILGIQKRLKNCPELVDKKVIIID
jgi:hypothetical protein